MPAPNVRRPGPGPVASARYGETRKNHKDIIGDPEFGNRAEAVGDNPTNRNLGNTIGEVIHRRFGRRDVMRGALAATATTSLVHPTALPARPARADGDTPSRHVIGEMPSGNGETHHVADGHDARIPILWGDPMSSGIDPFDPMAQAVQGQRQRCGHNNDCAGGITPWGTYQTAEESFHGYFWTGTVDGDGDPDVSGQSEAASMAQLAFPGVGMTGVATTTGSTSTQSPTRPTA